MFYINDICECSWLCFYLIAYFNDTYIYIYFFPFVFDICIASALGDLSCMESPTLLQIILMACLF